MTEKEKCQTGALYNANYDECLVNERIICKDLCHELNTLKPSQTAERNRLLQRILGKVGKQFEINSSLKISQS